VLPVQHAGLCSGQQNHYSKKKDKKEEEEEKKLIVPENWEEITELPDINATYKAETGRKTYAGLTYRIFKNTTNRTLIIAFRGSTANIGDWLTNIRWVTRVNPFHDDHYNVIQDQIHNLINFACKDLDSNNQDDIRIITTGHSLGGGLASNAAYSSAIIKEVVAINTSPVTGFYNIPVGQRIRQKKNIHIARIFEHGEILAFFRLPLRVLYRLSKKDPAIIEARFNFGIRKSSIKEHSLLEFADAIWKTKYGNSIFPD